MLASRRACTPFLPNYLGFRQFFGIADNALRPSAQRYVLKKTLPQTCPLDAYEVIAAIDKYREFIPYCADSFVIERDAENGNTPTVAGLRVGFREYDERFICNVKCSKHEQGSKTGVVIAESLSHALFDHLKTQWTVKPHESLPGATQMELQLTFQFKSLLYHSISSIFANSVTKLVVDAFDSRIRENSSS